MGKRIEELKGLIKQYRASGVEEKGLKEQIRALEKENKELKAADNTKEQAEGKSNNTKGPTSFICGLAQKVSSYIEKRQPSKEEDNTRNL